MRTLGKIGNILIFSLAALTIFLSVRAWYFAPKVNRGELAEDFTAVLKDGEPLTLSDLRGGYVLLDFWGSWCGPCRQESPELVALNDRFPELTIVSVAIERDSARWRRALRADGRTWPLQVMDRTESLRFLTGRISDRYGANQVPMHFLVDPNGRIVHQGTSLKGIREVLTDAR